VLLLPGVIAVFTGPAGSGKSSLVEAYSEWARRRLLLRVAVVNLDPGADKLLYNPTFDIRRLFTLREIMSRYNLGPNGAFIKASELIAEKSDEILSGEPFKNLDKWDIILVDTPGQMEAFLFRPASRVFLEKLRKISHAVLVYVIDASAIERVSDAVLLWFLFVLLQVKTGLLAVPVINKRDIARNPRIATLLVENPFKLLEEASEEGLSSEIISDLLSAASKTRGAYRAVLVSALELDDMEKLHQLVHEAFCVCGDLT
jgi:GTPase SAR1 family protein